MAKKTSGILKKLGLGTKKTAAKTISRPKIKKTAKKIVVTRPVKKVARPKKTPAAKAKPKTKKTAVKPTVKKVKKSAPRPVAKKKTVPKAKIVKAKKTVPKAKAKPKAKTTRAKATVKKAKQVKKKAVAKPKAVKPKKKKIVLKDASHIQFLEELVGVEGMQVVHRVLGEEVSDVELAETMDMRANIIRKHLYAMYESGVVTYRRHRSKTGWYTYYWQLHPERISKAIRERREVDITELQKMLQYEKNNDFFECKKKCIKAVFEDAMGHNFTCPHCEDRLEATDNKECIQEIKEQILKLRGE